jgi:hypothetical protein
MSERLRTPRSTGRPSGSTLSHSSPGGLHGNVVVFNFWTFTCIN